MAPPFVSGSVQETRNVFSDTRKGFSENSLTVSGASAVSVVVVGVDGQQAAKKSTVNDTVTKERKEVMSTSVGILSVLFLIIKGKRVVGTLRWRVLIFWLVFLLGAVVFDEFGEVVVEEGLHVQGCFAVGVNKHHGRCRKDVKVVKGVSAKICQVDEIF